MKPDDPKWPNWPFETLQRQMDNEPLTGLGYRVPPWLEQVQKRVIHECFGRFAGIGDNSEAYTAGFLVGWIERGWRDVQEANHDLEELIEKSEILKKYVTENQDEVDCDPITDEELQEIDKAKRTIEEHYNGNKAALSTREVIEYSTGYSEGLKATHGENEKYFAGKLKTDVFVALWILWPVVMHHRSSTVTWWVLCVLLGRDRVGDLESFRQLLKRHKIKIGKRGRPSSKK